MLGNAIAALVLVCSGSLVGGDALDVDVEIPWSKYLARSDLLWTWANNESLPTKWYHSAFIGNGALGMMVRVCDTNPSNTLLFVVSSSAIWDDREKGMNSSYQNNFVYDRPRLPVGEFHLTTKGEIKKGTMRLKLWDGQVTGMVQTTEGNISFKAIANARYDVADVMLVSVSATEGEAKQKSVFEWHAKQAQSTWASQSQGKYVPNPNATYEQHGDVQVAVQHHLSGTAHATAFQEVTTTGTTSETVLYVSISGVLPYGAEGTAIEEVKKALALGWPKIFPLHQLWWHDYYPKSFLSFQEQKLESFYWIQVYKLGSGTRSDRPVFDLLGPWFIDGTPWPDIHWDLNIQYTYYPMYGGNHLDLGESLLKLLEKNYENLINNVPAKYRGDSAAAPSAASSAECKETCYWDYGTDCLITSPTIIGNLVWTCQLYYLHYQYSMDTSLLPGVYRLLRRGVNYYVHLQYWEKGYYHLPIMFSPEYPGKRGPDTTYDLALYRWGLQTVIHIAEDLLKVEDEPMLAQWKHSLMHLVPYPVDSSGYQIAAGIPLTMSHRHFSHLFMVWPLATMDWGNSDAVALAAKSVDHWIGMKGALTGFCRPAVAVMSMLLDRPESFLSNLTYLMDRWILPNTFYSESPNGECGATPPMTSSAMQDMVLYKWDDTIHVFAGVDKKNVPNATFYHLRTQGAFLFSGRLLNGRTNWIGIEYDGPGPSTERLLIKTDMLAPLVALSKSPVIVKEHAPGLFEVVGLNEPGTSVVLYSDRPLSPDPVLSVQPVPADPAMENFWGLRMERRVDNSPAISKLSEFFQLRHHRYQPDTIAVEADRGMCVMVDQCGLGQTASLHVQPCLAPGQTRCSTFCDACEQWWIVHKDRLVSMATGQCLTITQSLQLQLHDCPWPVEQNMLTPAIPWPFTPQPSTVHLTDNGVEFFQINKLFHKD